jgi:Lon protease-like protein
MGEDYELREFRNLCRLFPLPGVLLFPHAVLPLHIFEPRYRQMTEDALAGDKLVTIVQPRPREAEADEGEPPLEEVACLGKILNQQRLPDGRFYYLLLGLKRVRLLREVAAPTLYRQAEAELIDDEEPAGPVEPRRTELIHLFRSIAAREEALDPDLARLLASSPPLGMLTDIIAHALGLPPAMKQAFLIERRVDRRADGLLALLRKAAGAIPDLFPPPFSSN